MHAIGLVYQFGHARNFFRFIPDTLQIGYGLDDRHDHAQIPGCGLAASDDLAADLVYRHLHGIDAVIICDDVLDQGIRCHW